ncbi:hypothetical protein EDB86DRAFT_2832244 [Lactarius hatsudake]|nr:hypothetical protein EDB86DRAFT_2832244 [Lactarius hatsudake]
MSSEPSRNQAPESLSNGDVSAPGNKQPQRERRSTLAARVRLSSVVSGTTGGPRNRNRTQQGKGKKKIIQANGVARPARNSGLNPSGNPSGSQLNCPVEIIQIPPLTSNIASLPPVAPVAPDAASLLPVVPDAAPLSPVAPDAASLAPVTSDAAPLPLFDSHNSTSNANFTHVYNFTAAQGDDGFGHHDSELSSNAMDYLRGSNNANILSDWFQVYSHHSTTNLDTASLLHDPFPAHHLMTNTSSLLPEQPLRPGEVTCGGITQPLPVSAWRIASAGPDQPQVPSSSRSGPNVIRGSGTRVDVLAHRHGRRPPYRLPPTPALTSPSEVSFPDNSRASSPTSTSTSTTVRRQAARSQQSQPDDCQEALSYAKHQYRLNLLTVNAMWPDLIAKVHANDQLSSARMDYGLETCGTRWKQLTKRVQKYGATACPGQFLQHFSRTISKPRGCQAVYCQQGGSPP